MFTRANVELFLEANEDTIPEVKRQSIRRRADELMEDGGRIAMGCASQIWLDPAELTAFQAALETLPHQRIFADHIGSSI